MCVLVYTLTQLCGHKHLQNVAECEIADVERSRDGGPAPPTEPRFLFDTAREAPAAAERVRQYPCRKRRAVRPALEMCEGCVRAEKRKKNEEELEAKRRRDVQEKEKEEEKERGKEKGKEGEDEDGVAAFLAAPRTVTDSRSAGSSLALMAESSSANTFSDVGTSGKYHP